MSRLLPLLGVVALFFLHIASATALTYKLVPNEKACFFSFAEQKGQKLAFYFAVRFLVVPLPRLCCRTDAPSSSTRFNQAVPSMWTTMS